jgi:Ni/Fe-hydrogenase 1 B-type cytochrome subunit
MSAAAGAVRGARTETSGLTRVYVWEMPVRLTHWLIALSIFTLAFTGFYIGRPFLVVPGEARWHFVTGTIKAIHFYAAIVFSVSVFSRVAWMFLGNEYARWRQFVPTTRKRWVELFQTLSFYLFLRRKSPREIGHNPLAGVTYSVVFTLYLVMIATGFAIYSASAALDSPMRAFTFLAPVFGGLQSARWIHHVGMWLLLGFFVHHLASAITMSMVERTGILESIFSGVKFVSRKQLREEREEARK